MPDPERGRTDFLYQYLINLPACVFVGVIDFLIIHAVYKKRSWKDNALRILTDLALTSLFVLAFAVVGNSLLSPLNITEYIGRLALSLLIWNLIMVLLIEIFFYNRRQVEAEKKLAAAEKEKIQYQYEILKAQINPHFLFNSLNVLSSLAYKDAEKANLFAKRMSGVYRYLLQTGDRPVVTLREELAFLDTYLYLEQIRFEGALFIEIENDGANLNRELIPVSLQLPVENALKHNVATTDNPLTIRITVTDEGVTVFNRLCLRTSVDRGGMGLKNLRKQYALYDKTIGIVKTAADFTVCVPFLDLKA